MLYIHINNYIYIIQVTFINTSRDFLNAAMMIRCNHSLYEDFATKFL